MIIFSNCKALINGQFSSPCDISVIDGKIHDISTCGSLQGDEIVNLDGKLIASGYIDIHTHGGGGCDVMEGTLTALATIGQYHLTTGTTSYCPTTLTADIPTTLQALANIRDYNNVVNARILGTHLEGPFISKKSPGAHPVSFILSPTEQNTQWVWDNVDVIARVTIAPDNSGSTFMTEKCLSNNIQVSIGHDAAIDEEIYATIECGANSITHMFNCTSRPQRIKSSPHKHLGLTEVGLISERVICEIIADNRHVPNDLFNVLYKLKGKDGICLVSDSLSVAGAKEGNLYLGSGESKQRLIIDDGVAILPDLNTYAGSVTPIAEMVTNLTLNLGIPLDACIVMGTIVPSKLLKLSDRGDIRKGYFADFNVLDDNGKVLDTYLGGINIKTVIKDWQVKC